MVIVGLTQPEYLVTEGEIVTICAQLQSGQLQRDATIFFVTSSDLGMYVCTCNTWCYHISQLLLIHRNPVCNVDDVWMNYRLLTFCTNCHGQFYFILRLFTRWLHLKFPRSSSQWIWEWEWRYVYLVQLTWFVLNSWPTFTIIPNFNLPTYFIL